MKFYRVDFDRLDFERGWILIVYHILYGYESNMHKIIFLHEGSNMYKDTFARRRFCTKGFFARKFISKLIFTYVLV